MSKYKVPEGMWEAAAKNWRNIYGHGSHHGEISTVIEAALLWLDDELKKMDVPNITAWQAGRNATLADIRKLFIVPEPEASEAVKDLMWSAVPANDGSRGSTTVEQAESRILEAYRRGRKSK